MKTKYLSKKSVRYHIFKNRDTLSEVFIAQASNVIGEKLIDSKFVVRVKKVSIYLPIKNEVQTALIIEYFEKQGSEISTPVYLSQASTWSLSKYHSESELIDGPYGVRQPKEIELVDPAGVNAVIFPGVAFTEQKVRIGYGKGVYDKLFAGTSTLKIGLAYDFQIVSGVSGEPHDLVMDYVITEKRII